MQAQLSAVDVAHAFSSRHLNLILFPTEKCNFRCTYCYEDFKIGRMRESVISGVKHLIRRRLPTLDGLEISWFGGEPLLALDIVRDLSSCVMEYIERDTIYSANMTTNGYFLTSKVAEELCSLGVRTYQVSLDGSKEIHDRTRVNGSGFGSFEVIWGNLLNVLSNRDLDITIILRVHFTPSTAERIDDLIEMINENFSDDTRVYVHFKSVEQLGGANDDRMEKFPGWADKERVRSGLVSKLRNPERAFKPSSSAGGQYICYAAKPTSLAIRADGSIAKCTVALYDLRNRIGEIKPDGSLSLDRNKLLPWISGFQSLDPLALACPMMALDRHFKR